jgi:branched-chain amino acid transport system substrate-binding protein
MKRLGRLSACMVGILVLFFSSSSFGAGVIKVGIVDTYSGPPATMSQDVLDGFKMVVNEINAKGGVL